VPLIDDQRAVGELGWSLAAGSKRERREILEHLQAEVNDRPDDDPAITVELLSLLAQATAFEHDWPRQQQLLTQALPIYRQIGDRLGEANTLVSRARLAIITGERADAGSEMAKAIHIYAAIGLTKWAEKFQAEAASWKTTDAETSDSSHDG
jgi:hypothetical protein